MQPPTPKLISEHPVCRAFFECLHASKLQLGQTVRQRDLCTVLGVGISPLREALALLEAAGLVTSRRKVGITIVMPDVEYVVATFQLRRLLEIEGLKLFLQRDKSVWVERTTARHAEVLPVVKAATDRDFAQRKTPVTDLEDEFHLAFIEAFDNREIVAIYDAIKEKQRLLPLIKRAIRGPTNANSAIEEHLAIIEAISCDDHPAAIAALERHLQQSMQRVLTG